MEPQPGADRRRHRRGLDDALRKHGPAEVVVAVPTAHDRPVAAIRKLADAVVCANVRGGWSFAVADAYETWSDVGEDEVAALLGL